jgi:hypothetical protein
MKDSELLKLFLRVHGDGYERHIRPWHLLPPRNRNDLYPVGPAPRKLCPSLQRDRMVPKLPMTLRATGPDRVRRARPSLSMRMPGGGNAASTWPTPSIGFADVAAGEPQCCRARWYRNLLPTRRRWLRLLAEASGTQYRRLRCAGADKEEPEHQLLTHILCWELANDWRISCRPSGPRPHNPSLHSALEKGAARVAPRAPPACRLQRGLGGAEHQRAS